MMYLVKTLESGGARLELWTGKPDVVKCANGNIKFQSEPKGAVRITQLEIVEGACPPIDPGECKEVVLILQAAPREEAAQ